MLRDIGTNPPLTCVHSHSPHVLLPSHYIFSRRFVCSALHRLSLVPAAAILCDTALIVTAGRSGDAQLTNSPFPPHQSSTQPSIRLPAPHTLLFSVCLFDLFPAFCSRLVTVCVRIPHECVWRTLGAGSGVCCGSAPCSSPITPLCCGVQWGAGTAPARPSSTPSLPLHRIGLSVVGLDGRWCDASFPPPPVPPGTFVHTPPSP